MDFFEAQDRARRRSRGLIVYFTLAVAGIIVAVYLACLLVFGYLAFEQSGPHRPVAFHWWNPVIFGWSTVATLLVVGCGSVYRISSLASGGGAVARTLGGRRVLPETRDLDERKLLNVVEEMALASGVPVPQVYVLDEEPGINAFAAGHTVGDAAIGVTRGCIQQLKRDELQGVIAHEFSHILNGDMRLNIRLMGLIFGILCLAVIGRILLRTRGRRNPLPLLGLALLLIGWIGVFFGRIIQAAVSRERERLADAAAVQFTRNPAGLAGALKKIGGLVYGSRLKTPSATEASHLFFSTGVSDLWSRLFATHPPLVERIRALDPTFDGKFPRVEPVKAAPPATTTATYQPRALSAEEILAGARRPAVAHAVQPPPLPAALAATPVRAEDLLPQAGRIEPQHLTYAAEFQAHLNPRLTRAASEPLESIALVYALLLSKEPSVRQAQLEILRTAGVPGLVELVQQLAAEVEALDPSFKLPMVRLALPALREMAPSQFAVFERTLQQLIEADARIDLFEYTLHKMILRRLAPEFRPVRRKPVQYYSLKPLAHECAVLLSGLALQGHDLSEEAAMAFEQGKRRLPAIAAQLALLPASECGLAQIDAALQRLSQSSPILRRQVLDACAQTVAADGVIRPREAELLRSIADSLDCPLPPFVKGV